MKKFQNKTAVSVTIPNRSSTSHSNRALMSSRNSCRQAHFHKLDQRRWCNTFHNIMKDVSIWQQDPWIKEIFRESWHMMFCIKGPPKTIFMAIKMQTRLLRSPNDRFIQIKYAKQPLSIKPIKKIHKMHITLYYWSKNGQIKHFFLCFHLVLKLAS